MFDGLLKISGGALWFLAGTAALYGEQGVYTVLGFSGFLVVYCLLGTAVIMAFVLPIQAGVWLLNKTISFIERFFRRNQDARL